ncbi:MAG TPA: protein kinase [Holophagaceae bacterium]|nr:protein kinase [Holophagaceae bacterium]
MEDSDETRQDLSQSGMETLAGDKAAKLSPGPHRIVMKPRSTDPGFPVADWDRYDFVRFLGQGGMGRVYLARDKRLGREVALKFVRMEDDRFVDRFMAEARAQARVDHPHVCKVLEVGEVEGKVFIAMQHIKGLPLDVAALELTLEQKVMVLRDAALGVHEAHRVGIIHRDLKPSNILVEVDEDGTDHAYVMDFGLAHEWNTEATETGSVLGTPAYMSPEQARGEVSRLDRRSDVYSLGATLYAVITGQPPVEGANPLEILSAVSSADPKPFRALKLDIPKDLEAITLKCLEKDRSRRYDSAKALAEDLDRFLAGDPVQARPTGFWYRAQRKARKHKQLTAVGAAALLVVFVALGVAVKARRDAGRRERLAQQFTDSMARIESLARYSALSPAHDIRPDLQAVRDQMARLRTDMAAAGALADGPGHYALGWGYWTLDDGEQAREHLQMAWDAGYREPRVAYALSLALGQQYREKLLEAQRITAPAQREARLKEVNVAFRDPALGFLRRAQGSDVPSPAFLEAQMAFFEGRLDEALLRLQALGATQPWFYEAPQLRGSLLQARAWEKWNRGDREGAQADFDAGRTALAQAGLVARSAPSVHAALGELELNVLFMEKFGGGKVLEAFRRGDAPIREALALQPDHVPSLILQAAFLGNLGDFKANHGEDSEPLTREAVAAAERAVAAGPMRADARMALGRACYLLGDARSNRNLDPTEALSRSLQAFESLSESKRDYTVWNHLGLIHQTWADFDTQHGREPDLHLGRAIAAFEQATRLAPQLLPARINLGSCLLQRARRPQAPQPEADLQAAEQVLQEARTLNPKHFVPYFVLGKVRYAQGLRAQARGGDAESRFRESVALNEQGLQINPAVPNFHLGIGIAQMERAREAWETGRDPAPLFEAAQKAFERALAVAPNQANGHLNLGSMLLKRARWMGRPMDLPAARRALERALALSPGFRDALINLGRLHAVGAELALARGADPSAEFPLGEAPLAQALKLDPASWEAWQSLGELRSAQANGQAAQGQEDGTGFATAREALRRALGLDPEAQETPLALARLAWHQATWERGRGRTPGPYLEEALHLTGGLLKVRPRWAEALALDAGLALLAAEGAPAPERAARREKAVAELTTALELNPHLRSHWLEVRDRGRS